METSEVELGRIAGSHPASRPIRIGLLGTYASGNLGDVAIQFAVMGALINRRKDIEFFGICPDPEDAMRTLGIPAFSLSGEGQMVAVTPMSARQVLADTERNPEHPSRPCSLFRIASKTIPRKVADVLARCVGLLRIARQVDGFEMLLVSGSGQLDDFWGGAWGHPFRLMFWTLAAHARGKPVAFFGVGVDELHTRLGAWFCLKALKHVKFCVVRDPGSRDALRALGHLGPLEVCPDPAFYLTERLSSIVAGTDIPFAIISPIARRAWPGNEDVHYDNYLTALARVADQLQKREIQVRFVCSQTGMDPPIIERIRQRMKGDASATTVIAAITVDDYLSAVSGAQLLVGSRLHALILALVAGTPAIAVSGVRKVQQQFGDIGLSDHAFEMRSLSISNLLATVDVAIASPDSERRRVSSATESLRAKLDAQFDRLSKLIPLNADGS